MFTIIGIVMILAGISDGSNAWMFGLGLIGFDLLLSTTVRRN